MNFKKEPLFPKTKSIGKRAWGPEELLALIPGVLTLKRLTTFSLFHVLLNVHKILIIY